MSAIDNINNLLEMVELFQEHVRDLDSSVCALSSNLTAFNTTINAIGVSLGAEGSCTSIEDCFKRPCQSINDCFVNGEKTSLACGFLGDGSLGGMCMPGDFCNPPCCTSL